MFLVSILILMEPTYQQLHLIQTLRLMRVSILILMEPTYQPTEFLCSSARAYVSILILMEPTYQPTEFLCSSARAYVSILILMEPTYQLIEEQLAGLPDQSFNPYFNGTNISTILIYFFSENLSLFQSLF